VKCEVIVVVMTNQATVSMVSPGTVKMPGRKVDDMARENTIDKLAARENDATKEGRGRGKHVRKFKLGTHMVLTFF